MAKKKNKLSKQEESSGGGGWEIVYSGFVLILLCFFIMLSSFTSIESGKIMQFVRSFVSAVSILPGGVKMEPGMAITAPSPDMVDTKNDLAQVYADLNTLANRFELEEDIELSYTREGLSLRLSDKTIFDIGLAEISENAIPFLNKIGDIISGTAYDVRIEGHTDNLPIHTAKFPSNWELSTARAVNVLRYFIETFHVPADRLSAEGFSEFQPIVPNSNLVDRAKNRRVELIFLKSKK